LKLKSFIFANGNEEYKDFLSSFWDQVFCCFVD